MTDADLEMRLNDLEQKVARVAELLASQMGSDGESAKGSILASLNSINDNLAAAELNQIARELRA